MENQAMEAKKPVTLWKSVEASGGRHPVLTLGAVFQEGRRGQQAAVLGRGEQGCTESSRWPWQLRGHSGL
jgi:hypothetical protein